MRLLLLGVGGQLGQEITAVASGIDLIVRTHQETDVVDANAVAAAFEAAQPNIVVNAAAYTNVDRAESEQEKAFRVNATGAGVIASTCARADIPLVHISTDYVFDGTKGAPYVETDATAPLSVYGASKLAGEDAIRERHKKHLILRTSWVYGRFGSNFLKTILRLAGQREQLKVVADQHGSPTSTADLAAAILALAPRLVSDSASADWGTYHFTGEGETNWWQFADEIISRREKWVGSRPKLIPITTAEYPTAARRPANSTLDNHRFRTTFGLSSRPWRASVCDVVDALLSPRAQT
jgi:dTDP-4-dehydrorhamnose reductase